MDMGSLLVSFKADISPLVNSLGNASKSFTAFIKNIASGSGVVASFVSLASAGFNSLGAVINGLTASFSFLSKAISYLGISKLTMDMVEFASSAEKSIISLNKLAGGLGKETYQALRSWAMQMPISTEEAIHMFTQLRARGITPTIEQMTLLTDTISALGDRGSSYFLTKAIGDIQSLGRLMSREVQQLANSGIPAIKALVDYLKANEDIALDLGFKKLGGEIEVNMATVTNAVTKGVINSQVALDALYAYMKNNFGGLSKDMMNTWGGLTKRLTDHYQKFLLQISEYNVFRLMKGGLSEFVEYLDSPQGIESMRKWAKIISDTFLELADFTVTALDSILAAIEKVNGVFADLREIKTIGIMQYLQGGLPNIIDNLESIASSIDIGGEIDTGQWEGILDTYEKMAGMEHPLANLPVEELAIEHQAILDETLQWFKDAQEQMEKGQEDSFVTGTREVLGQLKTKIEDMKKVGTSGAMDFLSVQKTPELPMTGADVENNTKRLNEWLASLRTTLNAANSNWSKYKDKSLDIFKSIDKGLAESFKSMEDTIVSFVKTGEFQFSNFVDSLLTEMIRLATQQTIMKPLASLFDIALDTAVSSFAGSSFGFGSANDNTVTVSDLPEASANPLNMKSYATGGNIYEHVIGIGQSTGRPYEFGERGIEHISTGEAKYNNSGNISVNVINNTGTSAEAKINQRTGPNGEKQLTIELSKALIKHDIASRGPFSQTMEAVYGLKRRG